MESFIKFGDIWVLRGNMAGIIFLGTAGDTAIYGKQIRGSGGLIIQAEGYQFHIDPGPGALVRASQLGVNLRQNTAILVSNNHLINCNDLNAVIAAMTLDGLDVQGVVIAAESVIPHLSDRHSKQVERVIPVGPEKKIGIENVEIQTLFTTDPAKIGFKIYTPQFLMSYSSNTGYSREIAKQYEGSDILILNIEKPFKEKCEDCLNSEDAVKIINRVKPKLAVITHFGTKMLTSDPLYESREIQRQTGVQVIAAKDGLVINPVSYSASLRQKTLNLYS